MPGRLHRAPTRTCVACRTSRAKRELVRIVRTPDGRMMMDATGRAAGRGAYLCIDPACRRTALARNILTRALGVALPDDLRGELESGTPDAGSTPALRSGVGAGSTPALRSGVGAGSTPALRSGVGAGSTPALRSGVLPGGELTQTHTITPGGTIGQE